MLSRLPSLLALFALLVLSAFQQTPPPLTGRVVDEEGKPLAAATVVLQDADSGALRYGATTDVQGRYEFDRVRPGRYELIVRYVGFAEMRRLVRLAFPEAWALPDVRLSSETVAQQEVVVTANRAEGQLNPVTFSNLTARELETKPAMKDLPVHLATLPSVTYYSENGNGIGYSTLRMRGFDQRRLAVAINGIPQNDPEDFNVFWINFFDIQGAVQDVQVQRGAGASVYGPTAIGGAINIVAVPYKPYSYAKADAGYGSFGTQRYTLEANSGLLADRYVVFGRVSRLLSDGYRDWAWTEFWRFFAGVARYGEHSSLTIQAYGGPQEDGLAFSGISKAANADADDRRSNFSALTEDTEHFHQPHLELLHDWQFAPDWTFHQALFGVKGEGYFDFGGTFRSADYLRLPDGWRDLSAPERALPLFVTAPDASVLFRAYLDQWQVGWLPRVTYRHGTAETTLGAEARLHRSLRWGRIQEGAGVPDDLVGSANDVRVYSVRGEKAITSLYGSHLSRPLDRLAVQADVQVTYRHYRVCDERFFGTAFTKPYLFVNPRLGVTVNPKHALSAYASVAWAHREPRLKALYDGEEAGAGFQPRFERNADGSLDLDRALVVPERLLDVELGAALKKTRYRLSATVFVMNFWDEIVPSGGLDQFGVPRTGNADRTRHAGIEIEGAARLLSRLDVRANATFSRNRFLQFTEYVTLQDFSTIEVARDGNPIAGFPERVLNLGLTYTRSGWTASVDAKLAGKQYIDNSGGEDAGGIPDEALVVDPYTLVDASIQYDFGASSLLRGFRVAFDVNNVLDEQVLLYGNVGAAGPQFFPAATRHVFASVRYVLR